MSSFEELLAELRDEPKRWLLSSELSPYERQQLAELGLDARRMSATRLVAI